MSRYANTKFVGIAMPSDNGAIPVTNPNPISTMVLVLFAIPFGFACTIYRAFGLQLIWGWFVSELIPTPSLLVFAGVCLLVNMASPVPKRESTKAEKAAEFSVFTIRILHALYTSMCIGFAWCLYWIMFYLGW